jgi:hypothetical protein
MRTNPKKPRETIFGLIFGLKQTSMIQRWDVAF